MFKHHGTHDDLHSEQDVLPGLGTLTFVVLVVGGVR
jgi:hypothetical protein